MAEIVELDGDRPSRPLPAVALIAHDAKKGDLLRLIRGNRGLFEGFRLLATRTTGLLIRNELELPIELMASGPMGGDLQIGGRIVEEEMDAVIFLRDPLTAHLHEPDIQALLKVCDVHQVPVATNLAAAEILLHFFADHRVNIAKELVSGGKSEFGDGDGKEWGW